MSVDRNVPAALLRAGARRDEVAGIEWWNSLSEGDRRFWLTCACSCVAADAWAYFSRCNPDSAAEHVRRARAVKFGGFA